MGKRDLARHDGPAPAKKARDRRRMVRGTKRPAPTRNAFPLHTAHRVDERRLKVLSIVELGQDGRKATGQHRLAHTRGTHHDDAQATGRGNAKSALGEFLPGNVCKISLPASRRNFRARRARRIAHLGKGFVKLRQAGDIAHIGLPHQAERIALRTNEAQALTLGKLDIGDKPPNGKHLAFKRELPHYEALVETLWRHLLGRHKDPHGHGQVERRAGLLHVGRRQAHSDRFAKRPETRGWKGAPHTRAPLPHRKVGPAHHGHTGQTGAHRDLHLHKTRLDAPEHRRLDAHNVRHQPSHSQMPMK